jgi:hypothetical protein
MKYNFDNNNIILILLSIILIIIIIIYGYKIYTLKNKCIQINLKKEENKYTFFNNDNNEKFNNRVENIEDIIENYNSIFDLFDNFIEYKNKFNKNEYKINNNYLKNNNFNYKKDYIGVGNEYNMNNNLFRFKQIHSRVDNKYEENNKNILYEIWNYNLQLKQQFGFNKELVLIIETINREIKYTKKEFLQITNKIKNLDNKKNLIKSHLIDRLNDEVHIRQLSKDKDKNNNIIINKKYKKLQSCYLEMKLIRKNILKKIDYIKKILPQLHNDYVILYLKKYYFYTDNVKINKINKIKYNIFKITYSYISDNYKQYKDTKYFVFQINIQGQRFSQSKNDINTSPFNDECIWYLSNINKDISN